MSAAAFEQTDPGRAYRQLFELGRGGMATVYLAESLSSGIRKLVVLKVLNPELSSNTEMRTLFRREAELAAQMNHPNVVQVMDVVEDRESPFIVMEYLDGASLSTIIKRAGGQLSLALHLQILCQVLLGLHHFHELRDLDGSPLNGVHRDVSPQNIMVLHDGPVKVLDFGIAKISAADVQATRSGIIKGRIQYMPPEQILGAASIDRRADLFAVGVILWEAVARRRMWEGKSEVELFRGLATGVLPNLREFSPGAPESILQLVQRATDVDPEKRFTNALEMRAAIEEACAKEGLLSRPHELAAFMASHFGDTRREEQLQIKAALRGELDSGALEPSRHRLIAAHLSGDSARVSDEPVELVELQSSRTFRVQRRPWGMAAALSAVTALVLVGAWAIPRAPQAPVAAAEKAPAKTPLQVAFEVQALPPGAEILLDGKLLGTDRFSGTLPVVDRKVSLEVRASGHLTEHKQLVLNRDMSLQIVLAPDPAIAAANPPPAAPADSSAASPPRPLANTRVANKPAGAPHNRSAKCNPPYVFAADGVKTYKPECF
ncbi:MAG TPA: serine/threonine-protein kinase [Polyangiaceae bacterium]